MFMEHGLFSMVENKTRQATGISKATMDGWTTAMTLNPNPVVFGESLNKEVSRRSSDSAAQRAVDL